MIERMAASERPLADQQGTARIVLLGGELGERRQRCEVRPWSARSAAIETTRSRSLMA